MKFCSFIRKNDSQKSWGFATSEDSVCDLSSIAKDLRSFLEMGGLDKLSDLSRDASKYPVLKLADIEFLASLPNPQSLRDGYAFRQHVEASRKHRNLPMIPEYDEFPVFYFSNHRSISGPGDIRVQKMHLDQLDFELEVAIVIGKEGKNIPAHKADEYVFGYTIWNDWSARGLQAKEMKLNMGPCKGKDFANALGPWLLTRDELASKKIANDKGEKFDLVMKAYLNGEKVSEGNLKDMTFSFAQIIERASYGCTLYPGDVIGSGTVGTGCFMELNGYTQNAKWIKEGDELVCEVEKLGKLQNKVVLVSDELR